MPTTVASLLILVLAILPGVPGNKLYVLFVGSDWREEQWQKVVRLLGFSVVGLALYSLFAEVMHLPVAAYLLPDQLKALLASPDLTSKLFLPLLGHFAGSAIAGSLSGLAMRALGQYTRMSVFSCAWDHFVYRCIPKHWAVVGLKNGEAYIGTVETLDGSVKLGERDIVLAEPALYDQQLENYVHLSYQYLFIPGELVSSIGAVHEPSIDQRVVPLDEYIFQKEEADGEEPGSSETAESPQGD